MFTMHHLWLRLKLKQRLLFGLTSGLVVLLLLTQTSLFAFPSVHRTTGGTEGGGGGGGGGDWASPREWQSMEGQGNGNGGRLFFRSGAKRHKLEARQPEQYGGGGAHLNMPRKDLDLSNYTSENDRRSHEGDPNANANNLAEEAAAGGRQGQEGAALNRLLADDTFRSRENVEKLLVAARFIKDTARTGRVRLDEFKRIMDPGNYVNGRVAPAPGDMLAEIRAREAASKLSDEEVGLLKKVSRFGSKQSKKRKGFMLNLYDERSLNISSWQRFHSHISQFELYRSDDPVIDDVIHDLGHQEIVDCIMRGGGTQLKLIFYLDNGARVLFKPMRFPRSQETLPNHFYFSDYERHVAEIGAFYLDRVLGFNRVVPTTGRLINISYHIKRFAEHDLLKTFFISPAGNICFHGTCDYYCDTGHAICGKPDLLEGSFAQYLPSSKRVDRKTWRHPWRRSYNKRKKAAWETDNTFCNNVRKVAPYTEGRRLVDLMDMAVFDFLLGNLDRHHYETFVAFGNYTNPIHLDNGRGFGKAFEDDVSILAPVYQCCLFRMSTLQKLLQFNEGPVRLSDAVQKMQSADLVAPILLKQHLLALDRRVQIILRTVYKCVLKNGSPAKVVIDDGF